MKKGYTDIVIILDRSGSMGSVVEATIKGFDQFVTDQKTVPGEATLTLVQFDDEYRVDYSRKNLQSVEGLVTIPRGMTALYDAIGRTINKMGKDYVIMPEIERPEKVVVVIITDGFENASDEFKAHQIAEMIKHQQDTYSWQFIFMGANQDAILSAAGIGIGSAFAMTYASNDKGVTNSYNSIGANLTDYRMGSSATMAFTDEDRDNQTKAGA